MAQKIDLLREVYRLKNLIAEVHGLKKTNIAEWEKTFQFHKELKAARIYDLNEQIERLKSTYKTAVDIKERDARTFAYYATPEGHAHKARIEKAIAQKQEQWKVVLHEYALHIDQQIQKCLGDHWGVVKYESGELCVGIIDPQKSTPERRESYFGQDIDIYYEEKRFPTGKSYYTVNCCTTGRFSMEGGQTVGERAMFYVGFGQLLANPSLVNDIKFTMAQTEHTIQSLREELATLNDQLADPLKNKQNIIQDNRPDQDDKQQNKPHRVKHGPGLK